MFIALSVGKAPPPPVRITGLPLPELCWKIHDLSQNTSVVMSCSAQFDPEYVLVVQGIEFSVGVRPEDHRVVYIATTSTDFKTAEGLSMTSRLGDARAFAIDILHNEPGWGYFLPLKSGWSAAFFIGDSGTDSAPTDDSRVSWFFKRRRNCEEPAN
jgi:hypothetical protein